MQQKRNKHQKVSEKGKGENILKNTVIRHSVRHEKTTKPLDLVPDKERNQ